MTVHMKHFTIALLLVFLCRYELKSEELSQEQMKIWSLENVYWESIKTGDIKQFMDLLHDKTTPWPEGKKIPLNKDQAGMMIKQLVKNETIKSIDLKPEAIQIFGSTAMVFYSYKYISDKGAVSGRITHTWIKQSGRWKMIGGMNSTYFSWPEFATQENTTVKNPNDLTSTFMSEGIFNIIPIKGKSLIFDWKSKGNNRDSKTKGPLDDVTSNCAGLVTYLNGIGYGKGYCVYTTTEGDMLIGEFKEENMKLGTSAGKAKMEFITGTGRLAGIKGEGETRRIPVLTEDKNAFKYIDVITYPYKSP